MLRYAPCADEMLGVGETCPLVQFDVESEDAWATIREQLRRVHIEIEYTSIYGDPRRLRSDALGVPTSATVT